MYKLSSSNVRHIIYIYTTINYALNINRNTFQNDHYNLLHLCNQIHQTADQLQKGITGTKKRNRRSGATARSRKAHKRKIAAAATANALANVLTDNTSMVNSVADAVTNIISPMKDVNFNINDTPVSMQKMVTDE